MALVDSAQPPCGCSENAKDGHDRESLVDLSGITAQPKLDRVWWEALLHQLNFQQRQVFSLRVLEGFDTHETAGILGWTELKVRVTLYRTRKALQYYIKREEKLQTGGNVRG